LPVVEDDDAIGSGLPAIAFPCSEGQGMMVKKVCEIGASRRQR